MSLLKLLAAGRSLIATKEAQSPYRMRTANLLPKFESPKNPFAPKPGAEPVNPVTSTAPIVEAPLAQPLQPKVEAPKMETISLFDAKAAPVPAPAPIVVPAAAAAAAPVSGKATEALPVAVQATKAEPRKMPAASTVAVVPPSKPAPLGEWVKKLNPLRLLPAQTHNGNKPLRAKATRPPVQAELSLEKVKVMRNDLSDADLEIMPAKAVRSPATTGLPDAAGSMTPMTRTQPTNWNRLTSSVAGAVQTMIR